MHGPEEKVTNFLVANRGGISQKRNKINSAILLQFVMWLSPKYCLQLPLR